MSGSRVALPLQGSGPGLRHFARRPSAGVRLGGRLLGPAADRFRDGRGHHRGRIIDGRGHFDRRRIIDLGRKRVGCRTGHRRRRGFGHMGRCRRHRLCFQQTRHGGHHGQRGALWPWCQRGDPARQIDASQAAGAGLRDLLADPEGLRQFARQVDPACEQTERVQRGRERRKF